MTKVITLVLVLRHAIETRSTRVSRNQLVVNCLLEPLACSMTIISALRLFKTGSFDEIVLLILNSENVLYGVCQLLISISANFLAAHGAV